MRPSCSSCSTGTVSCVNGCSSCSAPVRRSGDFVGRHPEFITDLGSDELSNEPISLEPAALADVDGDQRRRAARQLLPQAPAPCGPRPDGADDVRGVVGRALRPRRRDARCRAADRPCRGAGRRPLQVRDHGDGQDRRPRAQLPQRCRRDLRVRGVRGCRRPRRGRRGHPSGRRDDAPVPRAHRRRARSGRSTPTSAPKARTARSYGRCRRHIAYYERWATTWEFQALLKARFAAGDEALGQAYIDALSPKIWMASTRENFVTDVRAMRRRVIDNIPSQPARP